MSHADLSLPSIQIEPLRPTQLALVRHGEVEEAYQRVFGGRIDMSLSPRGHEQAAALANPAESPALAETATTAPSPNQQDATGPSATPTTSAPSTLLPPGIERFGVEVARDMREGLADADIVMMLRLQRERMNGSYIPSMSEYFNYYGLDERKLAYAKPGALVMHPGPMNRGVEIDSIVADGAQSLIREQVEMGVAVRMAVLEALSRNLPNA